MFQKGMQNLLKNPHGFICGARLGTRNNSHLVPAPTALIQNFLDNRLIVFPKLIGADENRILIQGHKGITQCPKRGLLAADSDFNDDLGFSGLEKLLHIFNARQKRAASCRLTAWPHCKISLTARKSKGTVNGCTGRHSISRFSISSLGYLGVRVQPQRRPQQAGNSPCRFLLHAQALRYHAFHSFFKNRGGQ